MLTDQRWLVATLAAIGQRAETVQDVPSAVPAQRGPGAARRRRRGTIRIRAASPRATYSGMRRSEERNEPPPSAAAGTSVNDQPASGRPSGPQASGETTRTPHTDMTDNGSERRMFYGCEDLRLFYVASLTEFSESLSLFFAVHRMSSGRG